MLTVTLPSALIRKRVTVRSAMWWDCSPQVLPDLVQDDRLEGRGGGGEGETRSSGGADATPDQLRVSVWPDCLLRFAIRLGRWQNSRSSLTTRCICKPSPHAVSD